MPVEVQIALSLQEIMEEMNALSQVCSERLEPLSDDGKERKKTSQLLAVGVLWLKWLEANPPAARIKFAQLANELAKGAQQEL